MSSRFPRTSRITSGWASFEVLQVAQDLGLEDEDLFILMQETPPVISTRKQRHARKNCAFLWVFRKRAGVA